MNSSSDIAASLDWPFNKVVVTKKGAALEVYLPIETN
jgi:hypothetical protein